MHNIYPHTHNHEGGNYPALNEHSHDDSNWLSILDDLLGDTGHSDFDGQHFEEYLIEREFLSFETAKEFKIKYPCFESIDKTSQERVSFQPSWSPPIVFYKLESLGSIDHRGPPSML